MRKITEIPIKALNEIELYDVVILHHGFEEYNRDYYFIIESFTTDFQGRFKILFTHCFDLRYRHQFVLKKNSDLLKRSWGDELILHIRPENENAYWWGQGFTIAYPGFSYDPKNRKARKLKRITGKPMYAVNLETDHYVIDFVFHDFKYQLLNPGTPVTDEVNIPITIG